MRWILARICLCLVALMAALPADAAPRPFQLRDGQVVITINLNGRDLPALLDTGAQRSMIEASFAREMGISSQRVGGGTIGASGKIIRFGRTSDVKIDVGAGIKRRKIGTYEAAEPFAPDDVHILIGMDLLFYTAVSLDFQAMTVDIQRATELKPPAGKPFALKQSGYRRPALNVMLGDTSVDLLLDTAASVPLHLQMTVVSRSPNLSALPTTRRRISGIDGEHEQDAIIIPTVTLADQTFTDVRATTASMSSRWTGFDGIIGTSLMRRFHIVFDFDRDLVWITPVAD